MEKNVILAPQTGKTYNQKVTTKAHDLDDVYASVDGHAKKNPGGMLNSIGLIIFVREL